VIKGKIVLKSLSSNPDYTVLTPDGWKIVKQERTSTDFEVGVFVEADSENAGEIKIVADNELEKSVEDFLDKNSKPEKTPLLVEDEAMGKFLPALEKGVSFVAKKLLELTPLLVRFNDDCDGISAGVLVKRAVESFVAEKEIPFQKRFLKDRQCDSAVYESSEAAEDSALLNAGEFGKKPLLFLLDFGANEESIEGLEKAGENFDIVVLDHHVYSEKAKALARVFLNPLEFGGTSSHTTGLIAFEFARRLSQADAKYAFYSLQSDKSVFWDKVERKEALVLDFLASQGLSLDKYARAVENESDLRYYYLEAVGKLNAAFEKSLPSAKTEKVGNAVLVSVSLEGAVRKNEFPPKGKVLNKIHDFFEAKNPLVASVGFDSSSIQFRVSKPLHALGFKATRVIELVKKEFRGVSGGGHEQAAAMRFEKEIAKAVLEKTLEFCRREIEKPSD